MVPQKKIFFVKKAFRPLIKNPSARLGFITVLTKMPPQG